MNRCKIRHLTAVKLFFKLLIPPMLKSGFYDCQVDFQASNTVEIVVFKDKIAYSNIYF